MATKKIHVIKPTLVTGPNAPNGKQQKRRVAAYARVSTDNEEQQTSYEAQVDFYTRYIQSHPDWEFVGVYADEGISGTSTKKREGFNRMIADAMAGKIDLILTKSISRFARNTVDSLTAIRQLKEKGVEVYFEKENIYTLDAKGEVMITIMSSLAQEESRSISENVRWGKRKSMADGKVSMAYKNFLGYERGEDGLPKIVEEEAKVVRKIYNLFLQGYTVRMIASSLTEQGVPTPSGKTQWSVSTIMSILQNEKYKGDALLQKTYIDDFLTKKVIRNHGEVQQYYVENSHPAIIDRSTFELVQQEIACRAPNRRQLHKSSPFAGRIRCGECGGYYGRKVLHSNDQYRYAIWRCNQKYASEQPCTTPSLRETEIEQAFIKAFTQILGDKEQYIAQFMEMLPVISDTSELEERLADLEAQYNEAHQALKALLEENKHQIQDQTEYAKRYNILYAKYEQIANEIAATKKQIHARQSKRERILRSLEELRRCGDILEDFDEEIWNAMVESVTVDKDKTLKFRFRDGTEVSVPLPEK